MYISFVDTCSKLLSVLQVSTTGLCHMFVPPEQVIPVALLRLPDVTPTSGILLKARGFGGKNIEISASV